MLQKLTRPKPRTTKLSLDQLQMIVSTNQNWLISMEQLSDTLEELDHLEATLEHLDEVGALNHGVGLMAMDRIQSLESITGKIVQTLPSMESHTYSAEAFKDSILPALQSVAQMTSTAYSDNFASVLTALTNVSLGSMHTAKSGIKRVEGLRQKLKVLTLKGLVSVSLSGMNVGNAFTLDGTSVKDLVPALQKDLKKSKILMEIIPNEVMDFAIAYNRLLSAADLTSDEAFQRTVLDRIESLPHPVELFAKKIPLDAELLFNTSMYVDKRSSPKARGIDKPYAHLADLATKQVVRQRGGKPQQRNDSVKLSKGDLAKLLDYSQQYCDLVINGWGTYRKMSSALDRVMKSVQKFDLEEANLSANNIKALKQLITLSKHIPQYYRNPLADETDRCIKMALAARVLVSRAVKSDQPA